MIAVASIICSTPAGDLLDSISRSPYAGCVIKASRAGDSPNIGQAITSQPTKTPTGLFCGIQPVRHPNLTPGYANRSRCSGDTPGPESATRPQPKGMRQPRHWANDRRRGYGRVPRQRPRAPAARRLGPNTCVATDDGMARALRTQITPCHQRRGRLGNCWSRRRISAETFQPIRPGYSRRQRTQQQQPNPQQRKPMPICVAALSKERPSPRRHTPNRLRGW